MLLNFAVGLAKRGSRSQEKQSNRIAMATELAKLLVKPVREDLRFMVGVLALRQRPEKLRSALAYAAKFFQECTTPQPASPAQEGHAGE